MRGISLVYFLSLILLLRARQYVYIVSFEGIDAVPFIFESLWNVTQRRAAAIDFCQRQVTSNFDCFHNLITLMKKRASNSSSAHVKQSQSVEKNNRHMVYFVHLHKSGGTAVCNLARYNNLTNSSNNCNPEKSDEIQKLLGTPIIQKQYLENMLLNGTKFIANEFGLPRHILQQYSEDPLSLTYFTLLREPASRTYSHFLQSMLQLRYAITLGSKFSTDDLFEPVRGQNANTSSARTFNIFRNVSSKIERKNLMGSVQNFIESVDTRYRSLWSLSVESPPPVWMLTLHDLQCVSTTKIQPGISFNSTINISNEWISKGRAFLGWLMASPDNLQFRILCGAYCRGVARGALNLDHFRFVRQRLDTNFELVGILEAFELSMMLLNIRLQAATNNNISWMDNGERMPKQMSMSTKEGNNFSYSNILSNEHSLLPAASDKINKLLENLRLCCGAEGLQMHTALTQSLQALNMWDNLLYAYARERVARETIAHFGRQVYQRFFYHQIFYDDDLYANMPIYDKRPWNGSQWENEHAIAWKKNETLDSCNNACCGTCLPLGGWFESVVSLFKSV